MVCDLVCAVATEGKLNRLDELHAQLANAFERTESALKQEAASLTR